MTTTPSPPDWRGLCEELVDEWDAVADQDLGPMADAVDRARAALSQPEPEVVGPSDAELEALADQFWVENSVNFEAEHYAFARAVLSRWCRPAPAPAGERQAAPVPVAVSERLPGEEDCDAEGRCWVGYRYRCDEDDVISWELTSPSGLTWKGIQQMNGWLPANALPLPSGEVAA